MDQEPEVIRQQMDQTRAALSDKVERLENQVVHTVQEATTAVQDTVENIKEAAQDTVNTVKDTVHETMHNVREAFDIPLQTRRHPWAMLAASVGLGFLGGTMLQRQRSLVSLRSDEPRPYTNGVSTRPVAEERRPAVQTEAAKPTWLDNLGRTFAPEIDKLKGLAVGTLVAVVRDLVTPSLPPQLQPQVSELFDNVNTRLGGDTVHGPILAGRE